MNRFQRYLKKKAIHLLLLIRIDQRWIRAYATQYGDPSQYLNIFTREMYRHYSKCVGDLEFHSWIYAILRLTLVKKKKRVKPERTYMPVNSTFPYKLNVDLLFVNGTPFRKCYYLVDTLIHERNLINRIIDPRDVWEFSNFDHLSMGSTVDTMKQYGTPKGTIVKTSHNIVILSKSEL